jgi:hypothetical protein
MASNVHRLCTVSSDKKIVNIHELGCKFNVFNFEMFVFGHFVFQGGGGKNRKEVQLHEPWNKHNFA